MTTHYSHEGRGFVVGPDLAPDGTTELPVVQPPKRALTATSEESEAEALVTELSNRLRGVRILTPSRADDAARSALREELARMVATAQQMDAHLAEADRSAADAEHDEAFGDWLTAPGGDQR